MLGPLNTKSRTKSKTTIPRATLHAIVALQVCLLLTATLVQATVKSGVIKIKILDSVTQSMSFADNQVPINCEQVTFDAYCRTSRGTQMRNTLLVQEDDQPPFRVACTMESRYSKCTPLEVGESFDARREKRGITIYYEDDKGKERKEFYAFADAAGKAVSPPPPVATSTVPAPPVAATPVTQSAPSSPAPVARESHPHAPVIAQNSASPSPGAVQTISPAKPEAETFSSEKVRCNFTSTPAGAEITVDGKYVGNTPSVVGLITGTHNIVLSLPGFATWKRELTVMSGSELNVNTALQKQK